MIQALFYTAVFYVETMLFLVLGSWLLLAPRRWAMAALSAHGATSVWLLEKIVGARMVVRGRDKLLPGPVIVACKHQSAWDTFALIPLLRDPAMIMKRELGWIPLYGWFSHKFRMIFVHREAGPAALRRMARDAKDRAAQAREIVIFPEGTRRPPGAPPDYKPGVAFLYAALGVPVCPVALNSGLYWPRRSFARYAGDIVVEFLDPIPPGLPRDAFMARLESAIETASARLIAEAAKSPNPPPTIPAPFR